MTDNYLLSCLFGISSWFFTATVAHEAIINGFPVDSYTYPYQVSLQIHGHGHVCGGGIIGDHFVVTAAHCVINQTRRLTSRRIFIFAGTIDLRQTEPPSVTVRVSRVFFPTEYHPAVEFHIGDIAVLKLVDSLHLEHRRNLKKLEFPRADIIRSAEFAGFGWQFYDVSGYGYANGHLRYLTGDVLSDPECERHFPHAAIQPDRHICIESHSRSIFQERVWHGPCIGDDGGPLVQYGFYDPSIIAILSRIPLNCDDRHEPAVYTRILHYTSMILNVMEHDHDPNMISLNAL